MKKVQSADGTLIAFEKMGKGPTLILVGGTFEQRAMESETSQLAAYPLLAEHFTVFHYDRRGRGDSTDTLPYAVEREIEDIEALIREAGGSAFLSGISAGAALAFEAALKLGDKVKRLAMYEPPYFTDESAQQAFKEFKKQLSEVLAAGKRSEAVDLMMMMLGVDASHLDEMRQYPMWPMWEAVAPTFAYETAILGEDGSVPTERAALLTIPTLVMTGSASDPSMQAATQALANAIPNAEHRILSGQGHVVEAQALAPVLVEFFNPNVV